MKASKKSFYLLLFLIFLFCTFVISSSAASVSYYETTKINVPVWSKASSSSKKVNTIKKAKTVLKVTGSKVNSSDNKWYQLEDETWVYSGNVKKHTHKYTGGYCKGIDCGYVYKCSIACYEGTFVVTNDNGATVWSRPYSKKSKNIRTEKYKEVLEVIAKTKNAEGNIWYQLDDKNWVYSGNVTERYTVKFNANGGNNSPKSQTCLRGKIIKLSSVKPERAGYVFRGWATSKKSSEIAYNPGAEYAATKNVTLYAVWAKCLTHTYYGGICKKCGYEYPLIYTPVSECSLTGTVVVTNKGGADIWSRPYSENSKHIRTEKYKSVFTVTVKTRNVTSAGVPDKVWYRLKDGNWVCSGNVTRRFTVKYNANGGKKAPASVNFYSGKKVTISSSKPKREGYVFQGWASSASAKDISCKPGETYSFEGDVILYAVWHKCNHDFTGGYGKCQNEGCDYEYPLEMEDCKSVFRVNGTNGTLYKKPYTKTSYKKKTLLYGKSVSVVSRAKNANGKYWYKLKDGLWISSDDVEKKRTYYSIDKIPYGCFSTLKNSVYEKKYGFKNLNGDKYFYFYNGKYPFYLACSAFERNSVNTELNKVNKELSDNLTHLKARMTKRFLYNEIIPKEEIEKKYQNLFDYKEHKNHKHYEWKITSLTASAGMSGTDININCKINGDAVILAYCSEEDELSCRLSKWHQLYPKFTVASTAPKVKSEAVGWFTDFDLKGNGYGKKSMKLDDYISLFTCTVDALTNLVETVQKPVGKNIYKLIKSGWSLFKTMQKVSDNKSDFYSSSDKSSSEKELSYSDGKKAYYAYKMSAESPIKLQSKGDYLELDLRVYKISSAQKLKVNISF